jgi:hypothetical protein
MRVGLHAQDIPSYGNRTHGAVVRQDAMWAGGDWPWPGDPVANVHWHGFYEIDPEEVAPILGIEL